VPVFQKVLVQLHFHFVAAVAVRLIKGHAGSVGNVCIVGAKRTIGISRHSVSRPSQIAKANKTVIQNFNFVCHDEFCKCPVAGRLKKLTLALRKARNGDKGFRNCGRLHQPCRHGLPRLHCCMRLGSEYAAWRCYPPSIFPTCCCNALRQCGRFPEPCQYWRK